MIKDRTNELTLYDFAANDMVQAFSVKLQRRFGCTTATFTLAASGGDWSAVESYFAKYNIVEISMNFGSGMTLAWSGRLIRYDLAKNTGSKRAVRKFECRGFWHDLKAPGCKVLKVYTDITVEAIVEALVADPISDETGVSSSVLEVETGAGYTPERAVFEDLDAANCITKCAELYGDVAQGVDENRRVYFRDEVGEAAAAAITFQLGVAADSVKMFDRKVDATKCVNYFIIEGREAKIGSPMTVVVYDPALDTDATLPTRMKKVKAPELVTGAELIQWGGYLLARDMDPKITAKLSVPKIDGKLSTPLLVEGLNANLTVNDENAVLIGKYQIQAVTYTLNGGSIAATFEIGNDLFRDEVDALGLRELLREIAAFEAKEFANSIEFAGTVWKDTAYYHMVGTNGMRNTYIAPDVTQNSFSLVDVGQHASDDDNPYDNSAWNRFLLLDTEKGGITTNQAASLSGPGRFVTIPIPFGVDYEEFAILVDIGYLRLFDDAGGTDDINKFSSLGMGGSGFSNATFKAHNDGTIHPFFLDEYGGGDYYSAMILNRGITALCDIEFKFSWGVPVGGSSVIRRHFYFRCDNEDDCYVVRMFGNPAASVLKFEVWRFDSGVQTALTGFGTVDLPISDGDEITLKIDQTTYAGVIGVWLTNEETSTTLGGWSNSGQYFHTYNGGCGFGIWAQSQGYPTHDTWGITSLMFRNAVTGLNNWHISRDKGETYEGGAPGFNTITGAAIDLGAYSGGHSTDGSVIIRGLLESPCIVKSIAIGAKTAT